MFGSDAIANIVTRDMAPKATDKILVPAAFAVLAAAIAVLSSPHAVCTPSVKRIMTFGTPARAPAPVTTDWPSSIPPERHVDPPMGPALSMAVRMSVNESVRGEGGGETTVVSNSTYAIWAAVGPIWKRATVARRRSSTTFRWAPTLPELSTTNTKSTSSEQGGGLVGGAGGKGGRLGGLGTGTPQIWIASICSKPDVAVTIFSSSVARGSSRNTRKAVPQEVVSTPCQMTFQRLCQASILVTKGAR